MRLEGRFSGRQQQRPLDRPSRRPLRGLLRTRSWENIAPGLAANQRLRRAIMDENEVRPGCLTVCAECIRRRPAIPICVSSCGRSSPAEAADRIPSAPVLRGDATPDVSKPARWGGDGRGFRGETHSRARNQRFQGVARGFAGARHGPRGPACSLCGGFRKAVASAARNPRPSKTRARVQSFQSFAAEFPGDRNCRSGRPCPSSPGPRHFDPGRRGGPKDRGAPDVPLDRHAARRPSAARDDRGSGRRRPRASQSTAPSARKASRRRRWTAALARRGAANFVPAGRPGGFETIGQCCL